MYNVCIQIVSYIQDIFVKVFYIPLIQNCDWLVNFKKAILFYICVSIFIYVSIIMCKEQLQALDQLLGVTTVCL